MRTAHSHANLLVAFLVFDGPVVFSVLISKAEN